MGVFIYCNPVPTEYPTKECAAEPTKIDGMTYKNIADSSALQIRKDGNAASGCDSSADEQSVRHRICCPYSGTWWDWRLIQDPNIYLQAGCGCFFLYRI